MEIIFRRDSSKRKNLNIKLQICEDFTEVCKKAADTGMDMLKRGVLDNGRSTACLHFHPQLISVYERLSEDISHSGLAERDIIFYLADEICGFDASAKGSFGGYILETLNTYKDGIERPVYAMTGRFESSAESYSKAYENFIRDSGGIGIHFISLEEDGRLGMNRKGEDRIHMENMDGDSVFFSQLDETNKMFGKNKKYSDNLSVITYGTKTVMESDTIICIASGITKAGTVSRLLNGSVSDDFPVSALLNHHNVIVFADREAASQL